MDVLYLLGSLAGVGLLVLLNWILLGSARATIASADTLATTLANECPGFVSGKSAISTDGTAALMEDARDGAMFVAAARGDGLVVRKLSSVLLRKVAREGAALTLTLNDFTFPKVKLMLTGQDAARHWQARLTEKRN